VAGHDGIEHPLQRFHIEDTLHPHCLGDVVEGAVRLELFQEPQSLLGKRKRAEGHLSSTRNRLLIESSFE